jgi:hypothetical protein
MSFERPGDETCAPILVYALASLAPTGKRPRALEKAITLSSFFLYYFSTYHLLVYKVNSVSLY